MKCIKINLTKQPNVDAAPAPVREMFNKEPAWREENKHAWDFTPSLEMWVDETQDGAEIKINEDSTIAVFRNIKETQYPLLAVRAMVSRMGNVFCSTDCDTIIKAVCDVIEVEAN